MNKNNEILSCTISEIWQTTGPIFSVDRGECPCLTHLFEVNPKFRVVKFCLDQEARNILYRMVWSVFRYRKPFRRGSQVWQKTDTRTDRLCDSKCRASLRCAAEKKQRNVPACHAGTCYTCPLLSGKSFIDHVNNSRKQHCACSSMTIGTLAADRYSFTVAGPRLWNSLRYLSTYVILIELHRLLKTRLFTENCRA